MKHPLNLINKHLLNATGKRRDGRTQEDAELRNTYKEKEEEERERGEEEGGICGEGIRVAISEAETSSGADCLMRRGNADDADCAEETRQSTTSRMLNPAAGGVT